MATVVRLGIVIKHVKDEAVVSSRVMGGVE